MAQEIFIGIGEKSAMKMKYTKFDFVKYCDYKRIKNLKMKGVLE